MPIVLAALLSLAATAEDPREIGAGIEARF